MRREPTPLEVAIGHQIKVDLAEREWTQQELADKVGITRETLGNYMKGHRQMPMAVFSSIAKAFECSPREFMARAEERISPADRWF